MRKIFVWGGGGLVICRWGELGLGRKRRNRRGEGRQRRHILTFSNALTDENSLSVTPSAILMEKSTRHPYGSTFQIPRWFRRYFQRWTGHVTRTDLPFQIPRWFRRYILRWTGHVIVRVSCFESVGDSVGKKSPVKTVTLATRPFFLNSELSVHNLVSNHRRNSFVGNYRLNYGRKKVCR